MVSGIKTYVSQINSNRTLAPLYMNYNGHRGDAFGRDTIFYVHGTDFPCSAILSYAGTRLVRVKEIVRTSSRMAIHQYYLRNSQLVFVEEKEVLCRFGQESPKIKYSEKDYLLHNNYYIAADTCLTKEEWSKGYSAHQSHLSTNERWHCDFLIRQAARYVTLFSHAPKRH